MGDTFTYEAQRALLGDALVKEYTLADLTSFPATGTVDPAVMDRSGSADYRRLKDRASLAGSFRWKAVSPGPARSRSTS